MSAKKVAIRYAKAFVDALAEKNQLDDHKALLDFIGLVERTPELGGVLQNVAIKPEQKAAVLETLSKKAKLPELVSSFLQVLAESRRLNILSHIGSAVTEFVHERQNIRSVQLTTATELDESALETFSNAFGKALNAKVQVRTSVDPDIIGGAVARVGSLVYDGSVRGQLARLRRQLVKES